MYLHPGFICRQDLGRRGVCVCVCVCVSMRACIRTCICVCVFSLFYDEFNFSGILLLFLLFFMFFHRSI